jgi:hypothetical protein
LYLYNFQWRPPDFDEAEDLIRDIGYDLKTGQIVCYLPSDDFRVESSGCDDWTEKEVREYYQDWTLKRVRFRKLARRK